MITLIILASCDFDTDDLLNPSEPSFLEVTVDCADDVLSVEALIQSDQAVSNVTIARTGIDKKALEPLFPTLDVSAMGSELTRWSLETAHDCEASFLSTWTAYTLLEMSATAEVAWPDVDLSSGPIDPPHGTDAGGSTVAITGTDMDQITAVWFGEAEGSIVSATTETLTVSTPAGTPGLTDVILAAGVTQTELAEAFTYYPDATGYITGFSQVITHVYDPTWFSIGSPYVTLDSYGPFVQFEMVMQEALLPEETYPSQYPEPGGCETSSDYDWGPLDMGSYITFGNDDFGTLALLSNGGAQPVYYYVESDIDPTLWADQRFDLTLPSETEAFPAMTIEETLLTPSIPTEASFDWTVAGDMTWGEDVTYTWGDVSADRVWWTLYASQGYTTLSTITCMADAADGELTVSWAELTADIDEDSVTTLFARLGFMQDERVPMAHDGSEFWSLGMTNYWLAHNFIEP
jgi:hypothetical protein